MTKVGFYLACYPELEDTWSYVPPLGFGYLAAYARERVPGVEFVVERRMDDLIAHKPDLIGISYVTHNATLAQREALRAKQALGCPVLAGGPHISTLPVYLPEPFDLAVLNEGEQTFVEVLQLWLAEGKFEPARLRKIQGVLFRNEEGLSERTTNRPVIKDLNTIPYPDRDLTFDKWRVGREDKPVELQIMTSRGCPYNCAFCSTIVQWGRGFRYPTDEYVVGEMELMRERYNPSMIHIYDDLFVVRKDRVLSLCKMIRERGLHEGISFTCFVRSNLLDDDVMEAMTATNFKVMHIGFESGSDEVLATFNKQAADMEKNRNVVRLARKHGVKLTSCFILGSPGEKRRDIIETFEFVAQSMDVMQYVHFTPLMIFPGTAVWEWGKEKFGLSEHNLAGVVMNPEDVADGYAYIMEKLPYLNEENIPRYEFNTYLDIGTRIEWMVSNHSYTMQLLDEARRDSRSPGFVADNVPLSGILKAKAKRRLLKLMPTDGRALAEARADEEK